MAEKAKKKSTAKEVIAYLVCGVLTTVVNVAVYHILYKLGCGVTTSGVISVICAKIFAYLSNKLFVFNSKCENKKELGKEVWRFVLARGLSGVLDVGLTTFFAWIIPKNYELALSLGGCFFVFRIVSPGVAAKYITQPIVIVVNYVLGKSYVFKGKEAKTENAEASEEVQEEEIGIEDKESRPFHTFLMLTMDFFQEQFSRLYSFLFSSDEEDGEDAGINKETFWEKFLSFIGFFRVFEIIDWVASLFGKKKSEEYYDGSSGIYSESGHDDGQDDTFAGSSLKREAISAKGRMIVKVSTYALTFLVTIVLIVAFWKISKGMYRSFNMNQDHIFRQAHMFESWRDLFFDESGARYGSLFGAAQIAYAWVCSKINYARLVSPNQYAMMSCLVSAICLFILAFSQTVIRMLTASTLMTLGLVFLLAGRNLLQLDGGLFALQLLLLLLILTTYRATVSGYRGGYKYFLIRCLLISLLAGMPGTMPVFAFICLVMITLTQAVGIIWNARKKGFGDFVFLALSRFLPLALPIALLWFFCGGLDPLKYDIGGDFWIISSPNPITVSPFLARTGLLCTAACILGALLMFLSDLKRCGLYCVLTSVFFYFYLRIVKLDPGTIGYASTVFLSMIIGAGGMLCGQLLSLLSRFLCRLLSAPRLRPLFASLIVLPFILYLLTAKSSGFESEASDLSEITDRICKCLDDSVNGFKEGDVLIFPKLSKTEEVGTPLYDVLNYENRRKAARNWKILEDYDFSSVNAKGYAWWVIGLDSSAEFGPVGDICDIKVANERIALIKSSVLIHSAQQLAAMYLAVLNCVDSPWSREGRDEICSQLALLPFVSPDDLSYASLLRSYRQGLIKGCKLMETDELMKSGNFAARWACAARKKDLKSAQRYMDLTVKELPDIVFLLEAYRNFGGDLKFIPPLELVNRYGLSEANFKIFTALFDKIYRDSPANVVYFNEWANIKRGLADESEKDLNEAYKERFAVKKELATTITNDLPREAVYEEPGECLQNRYFEKGLGVWRSESVKGEKLPSTFLSTPDLWLLAQGEPGGRAGVAQRIELDKGIYLGQAYARIPEGREAPDEISLKFRAQSLDAPTYAVKWRAGSQWTLGYIVVTNEADCRAIFYCGSENVASPGSVEFTDISFHRIDGELEEYFKNSPIGWRLRRENDAVALQLEENELELLRQKVLTPEESQGEEGTIDTEH
ncbi:GtrA family protein [bacterium]|nr:GtrA family protein [bacterium]